MLRLLSLAILLTLCSSPVRALVIGFESPPCPTCGVVVSNYSEAGVQFTSKFSHYGTQSAGNAGNGSLGVIRVASGSYIDGISLTSGNLFSLESVELAEYSIVQAGQQVEISFFGVKADDTVVAQVFTLDGLIDGVGGNNDFELFNFSGDFVGLKTAFIQATYDHPIVGETPGIYSMDNLSITSIPVPAAAWLFGSALAGLGWLRRKQAV